MTPANLLTAWARLLIESLVQAGVRDAVLSPGSRSTPFTWAALQCAGLRCHVVVDERSAAFFALGQAKASGRPALLVCTSGSAAANYLPALVEATLARAPLIVLSADRPLSLQRCGAPQTIDQTRIYGEHAKRFVELGLPDAAPAALAALQRVAAQAVADSLAAPAGPVHLNARADKPLEPALAADDAGRALDAAVDALIARGPTRIARPVATPDPATLARVAEACAQAPRGLVVCGPIGLDRAPSSDAVAALVAATGYPLLAEATSQLRFGASARWLCDGFDALLSSARFRAGPAPGVIIQIGAAPTSRAFDACVGAWYGARRFVLADGGWPDPWSGATEIVLGDLDLAVRGLANAVAAREPAHDAAWQRRFSDGSALAWSAVEAEIGGSDAALGEGGAVRLAVDAIPDGGLLALGNSLPVRLVDATCPARARARRIGVWSQRGANGIDGVTSGAVGAALASGRPTTLIIGDVGFLHDVGGLWAARLVTTPMVILVLDNDGGRIFEQLPIAALPGADLAPWITPPGLDLSHAAALYGLPFRRATTARELSAALAAAGAHAGASVIQAVVPPSGAAAALAAIRARVDEALGA